jgi:cytoskeletal protein CcmA (bactofilin family)
MSMLRRKRRIFDSVSGPATYITASTHIVGHITGTGAYVFAGKVDGDCDIDGPATLAAGGTWKGTMRATDLIISGEVDGDVIAADRVEVSGTARITGSLAGNSIAVAEGAVIDGEIKVTSDARAKQFEEKRGEPQT